MDVSIIIVSWNVKDLLKKCLTSIINHTHGLSYEIWVVDNHSSDQSADMVETQFPSVHLIRNRTNRGFATANNQALKKVSGRVVVVLNPDTELQDNALKSMFTWMGRHRDVGVAGCRLLNSDYSLQPSVRRFPTLISQVAILLKFHILFQTFKPVQYYLAKDFDYSKEHIVDQIKGAAFFIHRRAIDTIGFLDEGFWIWFEEVDYCRRAVDAKLKVMYTPISSIIHHQGESFRKVPSFKNQWRMNRSMRRYFKKHHSVFAYLGIIVIQPLSLLIALGASLIPRKIKETQGIRM